MAHVSRSIEVDAQVDTVHEQWLRFEAAPGSPVAAICAQVRWRAEVLTLEPLGDRTRITLKIEFEPGGAANALPARMDAALRGFAAARERRRPVAEALPA